MREPRRSRDAVGMPAVCREVWRRARSGVSPARDRRLGAPQRASNEEPVRRPARVEGLGGRACAPPPRPRAHRPMRLVPRARRRAFREALSVARVPGGTTSTVPVTRCAQASA